MAQSGLFRAQALEAMNSPDRLDQVMRVTSSRSWLALVGLAAVVLAAVLWGFMGSLPRTIAGQGILTRPDGVSRVVTTSAGLVREVNVRAGDTVEQGQVIARLESLPPPAGAPASKPGAAPPQDQGIPVTSPYSGHVVEILAGPGTVLAIGAPVVSLDRQDEPLVAYVFLADGPGKLVAPGMQVQISPSTVQPEQYGYLIGKVQSISEYPSTMEGLMQLFGNGQLVQWFLAEGPVLEVQVALTPSPDTKSGYQWSSPQGPPVTISPGTTAVGRVVLDEVRPIELVIPGANVPGR